MAFTTAAYMFVKCGDNFSIAFDFLLSFFMFIIFKLYVSRFTILSRISGVHGTTDTAAKLNRECPARGQPSSDRQSIVRKRRKAGVSKDCHVE